MNVQQRVWDETTEHATSPQSAKMALGLLCLMVCLPFAFTPFTALIHSFYSEWVAIVLGLCALGCVLSARYWTPYLVPRIALLPLGLAAYLLLQAAFNSDVAAGHAGMAVGYLVWAAFLMALAHAIRKEVGLETLADVLAWSLLIGGLWNCAAEWVNRSVGLTPGLGAIGQSNNYADYLALASASLLYLYARNKVPGIVALVPGAVLAAGLTASPSRSVWLYVTAVTVLGWVRDLGAKDATQPRRLAIGCTVFLGLYLICQISAPWLASYGLWQSPTSSGQMLAEVHGASPRLHIWTAAWRMFSESPWFGTGWGQFDWEYFLLGQRHPDLVFRVEHAHNLLIHLLAELGSVPVLLAVGGAILWLNGSVKEAFTLTRWWILALLTVLGIHSMLEYPLWYAHFLGICAVLLGMGETRTLRWNAGGVGRVALAGIIASGFAIGANTLIYYRTLEDMSRMSPALALEAAREIQLKSPLIAPYARLSEAHFLALDEVDLEQKLMLNGTAMHFFPARKVVFFQTAYLALHGKNVEADRLLRLAMIAYPEWSLAFVRSLEALEGDAGTKVRDLLNTALQSMPEICMRYYPDLAGTAPECRGERA
jgi:O-antigen ligase